MSIHVCMPVCVLYELCVLERAIEKEEDKIKKIIKKIVIKKKINKRITNYIHVKNSSLVFFQPWPEYYTPLITQLTILAAN